MVMWSFLVLRAARLQFLPHEQLESRYEKIFQTTVKLEPRRGSIYDRKGRELAVSIPARSLFADPAEITEPRRAARQLGAILKLNPSQLEKRFRESSRRFLWVARKLDQDVVDRIEDLNLKGFSFVEESRRIYPNDKLLAPILGMTGLESQGLEGLELKLDHLLSGETKKFRVRRDARGRPLMVDGKTFIQPPEGAEVFLTIDSEIQHELEKELDTVTEEFSADQAFGVIMEPQTGEIVAMGMSPGFDANKSAKTPLERRRNRTVSDTFEPGSVLKTFSIAAALEEGLIQPNTRIDTEGGKMKVGDRWIRESEANHNWQSLTVSEVLAFSSNVGTTKIALKLGDQKLRRYMDLFGFGQKTGIELPGEAKGSLLPLPWRDHLLSNISFGQGIAVTPLQVAAAYAAIANGGIWREPTLIRGRRDSEKEELTPVCPSAPEKEKCEGNRARVVVRPETAQALRLLLAGVTADGGTGLNARVEGFPVGGKTGTAQKVAPDGKGYLQGAYISSFAGFLPVNDPKYVIYIVVDHPKNRSYYGSQVAAPVFSRMSTFISRLEGWAPILLAEKNLIQANESKTGQKKLGKTSLKRSPAEAEALTPYRSPRPFAEPLSESAVQELRGLASGKVPNFQNLTLREVMETLRGQDVELRVQGSGVVHQSWPKSGEDWQKKRRLVLQLKPYLRAENSVPPDYYRDVDPSQIQLGSPNETVPVVPESSDTFFSGSNPKDRGDRSEIHSHY